VFKPIFRRLERRGVISRMPSDGHSTALVNDQTDRLYLVSRDGKVQCLREFGLSSPLVHTPPTAVLAPADAASPTGADDTAPPQPDAPTADENPFAAPATPPAVGTPDSPFGGSAPPPVSTPPANTPPPAGDNPFDNPFGGR
jgi:hypothetical protein